MARAAALVAMTTLTLTGCSRDQAAPAAPLSATTSPTAATSAPAIATAAADDPIVADVDLSQVRASDVRARLQLAVGAAAGPSPAPSAVLTALGASVLDALALRELRVLGQAPRPGESRAAAVDRLLPLAFAAHGCARVDEGAVRLRFLRELRRYRHPRGHIVWEAHLRCCEGAACAGWTQTAAGQACRAAALASAAALRRALPPTALPQAVTAGVAVSLEESPCRAAAIPAFEAAIAAAPSAGVAPELRRYTFYARADPRFPETAFRRGDPALEAALAGDSPLCAVVGPLEVADGVTLAMRVGQQPAAWGGRDDAAIRAAIGRELCAEAAIGERDAWLERLGARAQVRWRREAISAAFGADVAALLQPWAAPAQAPQPAAPIRP